MNSNIIKFTISVHLFISTSTGASACEARNEAEHDNGYFKIGYSSWVDEPLQGDSVFKYSRYIRALGERWVRVDWDAAGLSGIAHPERPAFAQYLYLTGDTVLADADLRFGRRAPLEHKLQSQFLQNELESDISIAITEKSLTQRLEQFEFGEFPIEAHTIVTSASVNFEIDDAIFGLDVGVFSSFQGLSESATPVFVSIEFLQLSEQGSSETSIVGLRPRSELLSEAFNLTSDAEIFEVPIDISEGTSFPLFLPENVGNLNIYKDVVDVVSDGTVLASFPVSFYADSRMNRIFEQFE